MMLTGENGILRRASEAKERTEAAQTEEQTALSTYEDYIYEYTTTNIVTEAPKSPVSTKTIFRDLNSNNKEAVIPRGFYVLDEEDNETTVIDKGLVVVAPDGSEYVWVPIENIEEMAVLQENSENDYEGIIYDITTLSGTAQVEKITRENGGGNIGSGIGYREPDIVEDERVAGVTGGDNDIEHLNIINSILETTYTTSEQFKKDLQADFNDLIASIIKYKGFYVGRYETSIEKETDTAISKSNVLPATAALDSANTWYGLYAYQKELANKYIGVKSYMIWGCTYDAILRWALEGEDKVNVLSTTIGNNISNAPYALTGQTKTDKINNIYDLSGNGQEWTLEVSQTTGRTRRRRKRKLC